MDTELQKRILNLENRLEILSNQLYRALSYIEDDPHSSLTKSRTILEQVLMNIYRFEMNQEPKKNELGAILTYNQFTKKIDRRIVSRMNAIRDMCNLGVHGEYVSPKDAKIVLDNLCEVLEWYFENYKIAKSEKPEKTINSYSDWDTSLSNGLLILEIETKNDLLVDSLSDFLYDYMINKRFSLIDSRNTQTCLLELLNNVKYHVKESPIAIVKICFEEIAYKKISVLIEVIDKGPGFNLNQSILENEKLISEGGREHGLLRAFRIGSELSQKYENGNKVSWRKILAPSDLEIPTLFDGKDFIIIAYDYYKNYFRINNEYYYYKDFYNLVEKFTGNLISTDYTFELGSLVKLFFDTIRKETCQTVVLYFSAGVSAGEGFKTMVVSLDDKRDEIRLKQAYPGDIEPALPVLCHIVYKYIQEETPAKKMVIYFYTQANENIIFLNKFCKKRDVILLESPSAVENYFKKISKKSLLRKFGDFLSQ
jgi:hypothetical protein